MKKTITICDLCKEDKENEDEDVEATDKCVLCNKDVCDDCWVNYGVEFGEEDEQGDRLEWIICRNCLDKITTKGKEDDRFLDKIEKETLKHFKQKVFLGELER